MDIIVEMKSKSKLHWDSEVNCEACHGESMEHVDVEDNSIKPDLTWSDSTVQVLCKDCHENSYREYQQSKHASWYCLNEKAQIDKKISCITCHGAHGFKSFQEIEKSCSDCHASLPSSCSLDQEVQKTQDETFSCSICHNVHSLAIKETEPIR
jgi:hypothetical protein